MSQGQALGAAQLVEGHFSFIVRGAACAGARPAFRAAAGTLERVASRRELNEQLLELHGGDPFAHIVATAAQHRRRHSRVAHCGLYPAGPHVMRLAAGDGSGGEVNALGENRTPGDVESVRDVLGTLHKTGRNDLSYL